MSRLPLALQVFELEDFKSLLPAASKAFTKYCREAVVLQIDREKPSELSLTNVRVTPEEDIFYGLDKLVLRLVPEFERRVREYNRTNWIKAQNIISSLSFTSLPRFYSDFKNLGLVKCVEKWSDVSEGTPIQA